METLTREQLCSTRLELYNNFLIFPVILKYNLIFYVSTIFVVISKKKIARYNNLNILRQFVK